MNAHEHNGAFPLRHAYRRICAHQPHPMPVTERNTALVTHVAINARPTADAGGVRVCRALWCPRSGRRLVRTVGKPGRIIGVSVQLNHIIVSCRDQQRSAAFLTGIPGSPPATRFWPFLTVEADNGISLDFSRRAGRSLHSLGISEVVTVDRGGSRQHVMRRNPVAVLASPVPDRVGAELSRLILVLVLAPRKRTDLVSGQADAERAYLNPVDIDMAAIVTHSSARKGNGVASRLERYLCMC